MFANVDEADEAELLFETMLLETILEVVVVTWPEKLEIPEVFGRFVTTVP